MMEFDYSKLKGKIKEIFGTQELFANAMNISATSISDKLNNKVQFKQKEIDQACLLLKIESIEIPNYFFYRKS